MAEQLLLFADELRTRAKEILIRAANTDDLEAQDTMRLVAAGYEKLARRVDKRVREAREARETRENSRRSRNSRGSRRVATGGRQCQNL